MTTENSKRIDVEHIIRALPHRYPFLLVDRVVDYDTKWIKAVKNVTINEPFFQGHFPGHPVMPGVLILESLAQCAGVLAYINAGMDEDYEALFYLVKIDKARFSKLVVPGDQLDLKVELTRTVRNMALYECIAKVDGVKAASAQILCAEQTDR